MPIYALDGKEPVFEDRSTNWIAPDAVLIGDVWIGRDVGIWFGAVLRGDNELIEIGAGSNIQENVVLHTDPGLNMIVGKGCTIGHKAMLHGCRIGDNSLIGMAATVLNGSVIGENSLVGAGALVTENKEFPAASLIVGSPARVARQLGPQDIERLKGSAQGYVLNAKRFMAGLKQIA